MRVAGRICMEMLLSCCAIEMFTWGLQPHSSSFPFALGSAGVY